MRRRTILTFEGFDRRYFRGQTVPINLRWLVYQDYVGSGMTYINYRKSTVEGMP